MARKFGWRIQPSGAAAENVLGLSTQVPSKIALPVRRSEPPYRIGKTTLEFEHAALKESGFKLSESALIVQALKSLGPDEVSPQARAHLRAWLPSELRSKVLSDTRTATGWVYAAIREICREDGGA